MRYALSLVALLLVASPARADQLAATANLDITFGEWIPQSSLGLIFDDYSLDGQFSIGLTEPQVGVPHEYDSYFLPFLTPDTSFTARVYSANGYVWRFEVPMDGSAPDCTSTCAADVIWHQPFNGGFSNSIWAIYSFERAAAPIDERNPVGAFNWWTTVSLNAQFFQAVPEPASLLLLASGLVFATVRSRAQCGPPRRS